MLPLDHAISQAPQQTESQGQTSNEAKPSDQAQAPTARKAKRIKAPTAEQRQRRADQRSDDDLKAQRRMAKAAWAQVVFTFLGTVLLAFTLIFTAKATRAAATAAKAAVEAVHTERAWMSFSGLTSGNVKSGYLDDVPIKNGLALTINWLNTGRSPALRASIICTIEKREKEAPRPTFEVPADVPEPSATTLGPQMTASSNTMGLGEEEYKKLRARDLRIYTYCRITYRDIFSEQERFTELCAEIVYVGDAVDTQGNVTPQIGVTPYGSQNSAT